MKKDEILVVEVKNFMKHEEIMKLHEELLNQRNSGIILLPPGCKAVTLREKIKSIEVRTEDGFI